MAKAPDKNAGKENKESERIEPLAGGIQGAGGPAVPVSAEDVMTEQAKAARQAEKTASETEKTAADKEKPEEKAEEKAQEKREEKAAIKEKK
jgi:hypothetical protein